METDPRPRRAEGAADLETFLVEWKPNPPTPSRRGRTPLETFLVEWKLLPPPCYSPTGYPLKPS